MDTSIMDGREMAKVMIEHYFAQTDTNQCITP